MNKLINIKNMSVEDLLKNKKDYENKIYINKYSLSGMDSRIKLIIIKIIKINNIYYNINNNNISIELIFKEKNIIGTEAITITKPPSIFIIDEYYIFDGTEDEAYVLFNI
jgi:hypothetical protein